jgi:hypothetical protein
MDGTIIKSVSMKRYYFSGIVHPERALMSVEVVPILIQTSDGKDFGTLKFNIYNNQLTAVLECDDDSADLLTLRNHIKVQISSVVNVMGFLKGRAYDIEITKVFNENLDETEIFGIEIPVLEQRNIEIDLNQAANHIHRLLIGVDGIYLRRCFEDFILSMRYLDDTIFYCVRGVEVLRQYFGMKLGLTGDEKKYDSKTWEALRTAINMKEDELKAFTKMANPSRHGVPIEIKEEQRIDVFHKAWGIAEEFINYRLREEGIDYQIKHADK